MRPARPHILKLTLPTDPLKRFEERLPATRAELLKMWSEMAMKVRAVDAQRYFSVQEALAQDIPLSVLVMYVFRECRRALESAPAQERLAK